MDNVYVLNNPWAIQSVEKHTSYCAMMRLGFHSTNLDDSSKEYPQEKDRPSTDTINFFSPNTVGKSVGYPAFLKPYDGELGWSQAGPESQGVTKAWKVVNVFITFKRSKGLGYFCRGIIVGPQVNVIKYDPAAPLHQICCRF